MKGYKPRNHKTDEMKEKEPTKQPRTQKNTQTKKKTIQKAAAVRVWGSTTTPTTTTSASTPVTVTSNRVLIIEPNEDLREFYSQILRVFLATHYKIHLEIPHSTQFAELLRLAATFQPSVIILELVLPTTAITSTPHSSSTTTTAITTTTSTPTPPPPASLSPHPSVAGGLHLLRRLRTHPATAHCKLVVLTGMCQPNYKKMAYRCGADLFLVKPISINTLLQVILSALHTPFSAPPLYHPPEKEEKEKSGKETKRR